MNKKNILLVKIEERGTQKLYVPFGILILAGALKKRGFDVGIVHRDFTGNLFEFIRDRAQDSLFIGFSTVTSPTLKYALEISQKLKDAGHCIVWGGPHASLLPGLTMKESCIDYIIRGEGEKSVPMLAERLVKDKSVDDIPGIVYRKGSRVIINDFPPLVQNLDDYPPAFQFIDMNQYMVKIGKHERVATIMASKGCPHRCTFCFNTVFNKCKIRYYGPGLILEQVEYMKEKYDIDGILLNDDNFFAHRRAAMSLLEKIDVPWAGLVRAPMLKDGFFTEDVLKNCISLRFGGESGADSMLKKMKKAINTKDIENGILFCKKHNIPIRVSFILFFPLETDEERRQTVLFIYKMSSKYNIDLAWKVFNPYPGTVMFDEALSVGWNKPNNILEWAGYFRSMKIQNLNYIEASQLRYCDKMFKLVKYGIYFNRTKYKNQILNFFLKIYRNIINYRWRNLNVKMGVDFVMFDLYWWVKSVLRKRKLVR